MATGAIIGAISIATSVAGGVMQAQGAAANARYAGTQAQFADQQNRFNHDLSMGKLEHDAYVSQYDRMMQRAGLQHQEAMSDIDAKRLQADYESKAQASLINAGLAKLGGVAAQAKGDHAIAKYSQGVGNRMAAQRTRLAANGIVMDEGSAENIQQSAELVKDIDIDTLKSNAMMEAWGYKNEEANYKAQAAMLEVAKNTTHGKSFGSQLVDTNNYFVGSKYVSGYNPHLYNTKAAAMPALINTATNVASSLYSMHSVGAF